MGISKKGIDNLKIDEVFNLIDEVNKRYTAVFGWGVIINNKLLGFAEDSYILKTSGTEDYDLIESFFKDFEFDLLDGFYEFKFLLSYSKAQIGDYPPPNIEIPAYYDYVDAIFEKKASIEEYNNSLNGDCDDKELPW